MLDVYRLSSKLCKACPLKSSCISDKTFYKQMYRWEHGKKGKLMTKCHKVNFLSIIDTYTTKMNTKEAKDIVKKRLDQQSLVQ